MPTIWPLSRFVSLLCAMVMALAVFPGTGWAQHLYMRKVDTEKGVQAHDVYSVFQDSRHYLWFSTDAGIWRFDGKQYFSFTTANGLPDNVTFSLTEDLHQRIWLRMYSNKLAYIQNDKVTVLPCSEKLSKLKKNEVITSFEIGAKDTVYITYIHSTHVIKIAPPYRAQDIHIQEFDLKSTHFIYETPSGEVLVGKARNFGFTLRPGFTLISSNRQSIVPLNNLYDEKPRLTISKQKNNTYLVGVGNLLYRYKDRHLTELMTFENPIMDAQYDRNDNLWVSVHDKGLCLYRNTDTDLRHPEIYLAGAVPNGILQDTEGSYWITTLKNGIYYVPYDDINLMNHENGLSENISFSYYEKNSHRLFGFAQGTLYVLKNRKIEKAVDINIHPTEKNEINYAIEYDRNKLLCLGRHSFFLDKKTYRIDPLRMFYVDSLITIRSVFGCMLGDSVFCSMQGSLGYIDRATNCAIGIEQFTSRINVIITLGKNELLMGTEAGLVRYHLHTRKKTQLNFLPPSSSVKGIEYSASNKGFFIIMKNGIVYLTDSLLTRIEKTISRAEGHAVRSVYNDGGKTIWMATSNGIYQLDESLHMKNISKEDGLPDNLINNICIAGDTAFVSAEKGLITFPKTKTFFNDVPPVLYCKSININGVDRGNKSRYELAHNENFIKITYQALHYRINSDVEYRYLLHGVDGHWQTTRNNTIEYTTLPPGDYNFEMYAINNDGVKSDTRIRLHFTILPPFWNTWWFIFIVVFVLLASIVAIFVSRVRQIKKREEEKNELTRRIVETEMQALRSQMNPHFIFNSINSIQHLVLINEPLTANYYLTKFSKLMRNVLEQSRMELVPLEEELENIQLYITIESLRFESKFSHSIRLGKDIGPEMIFVPPMIIQPFIENAIWHGLLLKEGEKKLQIGIYVEGDYLHIEIDDNGIGREEAKKYSSTGLKKESLGMKITMQRLHLLEKNQNTKTFIHIDDKMDSNNVSAGTKATIQLPILKNPYDKSSNYR